MAFIRKQAALALIVLFAASVVQAKEKPWTGAELDAMARTLAGECFDDKEQDKRKVCEVILNRVSHDKFGNSILSVTTAPHQFQGYWKPSRPVSQSDYRIAAEALQDWHDNGCKALSKYLYFTAGSNRENKFR